MTFTTIATILMLLLLLLCSQICIRVIEYNPAEDQKPDSPWHTLIRTLSCWISEEGGQHNV